MPDYLRGNLRPVYFSQTYLTQAGQTRVRHISDSMSFIAVYLFLFTLELMTPSSITRPCMQNLLGVHEIKEMNTHSCIPCT